MSDLPPPPPPAGKTKDASSSPRSRRTARDDHEPYVTTRRFECPVEDCNSRTSGIMRQAWCGGHDSTIEMKEVT